MVADGRILGSINAEDATLVAEILRTNDLPRLADFFDSLGRNETGEEVRCSWCGAYPIFPAMPGHRCPTTGRFERFEHTDSTEGNQ